jgi:tetratricopeptide (TPR) repeat protein
MVSVPDMNLSIRSSFIGAVAISMFLSAGFSFAQTPKLSINQLYASANADQAHGNLQAAIRDYRQILQLNPNLAAAYNNLGSLYYDTQQYQKAIATLQKGLRIDSHMASSHAILGSAYLAVGRVSEALPELRAAATENPSDKRSKDLLEQSLIINKEYWQAANLLREQLKETPDNQDAWYRLGKVYLRLSQQALSKASSINPNSPIAHELQGEMQEELGNQAAAQREYELAVKEGPDMPGTHEHLGNIFWIQGLWAKAQNQFEAELANDADNCRVRWKLADSILNENVHSHLALSDLNLAIQRCPELMQARVDRARALIQLGRSADGLPDLLMAEKQNPNESTIHFLLAKVYRAKNEQAQAKIEMELFGKLVYNSKHAHSTMLAPAASSQH